MFKVARYSMKKHVVYKRKTSSIHDYATLQELLSILGRAPLYVALAPESGE